MQINIYGGFGEGLLASVQSMEAAEAVRRLLGPEFTLCPENQIARALHFHIDGVWRDCRDFDLISRLVQSTR